MTIVEVVWEDARGDALTPYTLKDIPHVSLVMQTIGWLLKDDEKGITLANERHLDEGQEYYRGTTFVPRVLIRSVTPFVLTKPRKKRNPE